MCWQSTNLCRGKTGESSYLKALLTPVLIVFPMWRCPSRSGSTMTARQKAGGSQCQSIQQLGLRALS